MPLFRVSSPLEVFLRLERVSINTRRDERTFNGRDDARRHVIYRDHAIGRHCSSQRVSLER